MSRGYGRGSIVSFIVVGIVLTALVLGGLYAITAGLDGRLGGVSAEEAVDETVEVAQETVDEATDDTAESTDEEQADEEKAAQSEAEEAPVEANDDEQALTSEDEDETSGATTDENSMNDTDTAETTPSEDAETDTAMPTTGVELPQTGLGDTLLGAVPLVALVGAVVAYRRSNLL